MKRSHLIRGLTWKTLYVVFNPLSFSVPENSLCYVTDRESKLETPPDFLDASFPRIRGRRTPPPYFHILTDREKITLQIDSGLWHRASCVDFLEVVNFPPYRALGPH